MTMTNKNNLSGEEILETLRLSLWADETQKAPIVVTTLSEDGWRASISWGMQDGLGRWISGPCETLEKAAMDLVERVHTDMVATAAASSLELN